MTVKNVNLETSKQYQDLVLKAILENVVDGIIAIYNNGEIFSFNRAAERIFGYSAQEIIGKNVSSLMPEPYCNQHDAFINHYLKTGQPHVIGIGREVLGLRKDGSLFPLDLAVNEIKLGDQIMFVGIVRDITERKKMEEEVLAYQAKLLEKTYELGQMNQKVITINQSLQAENIRMSTELDIARRLQRMILPTIAELRKIQELEIAGFMEAADEVAGDYYDVLQDENGTIKIGIGDVMGHGLESGLLMLMVQTAARVLSTSNITDLKSYLNILNATLYHNIQRLNLDKGLSLSLLNYHEGKFYFSGQHEEILVVRENKQVERIDTTNLGFFLGLKADISPLVAQQEVDVHPGDGIVLYTDGVIEAMNELGQAYGLDRLCQIISQHWHRSAVEIQQTIVEDVHYHMGTQKLYDDLTLVIIKVLPQGMRNI